MWRSKGNISPTNKIDNPIARDIRNGILYGKSTQINCENAYLMCASFLPSVQWMWPIRGGALIRPNHVRKYVMILYFIISNINVVFQLTLISINLLHFYSIMNVFFLYFSHPCRLVTVVFVVVVFFSINYKIKFPINNMELSFFH